MNLIDALTNEFQQLLNDQKKNQILKPMIQQVIDDLKKNKNNNNNNNNNQIVPVQEIIKILVRLPENRSNNTAHLALNIISKLFKTKNLIKENDYHSILHSLYLFKEDNQETVHLKLIECSINLIHPEIINIKNPECIEKLICIFFTLIISKNPIIQNTSMTGLYQIMELLFTQYRSNPHKNGVLIFNQLTDQILGKQRIAYIVQHQHSKGVCRDLVFHVIKHLNYYMNEDEQLSKIVSDKLSSLIYEEMGLDSNDVQFNARRIRDSFRIIQYLNQDIQLIKHISLLFQRTPSMNYVRYWILEGIESLLEIPQLVLQLHLHSEEQQSTYLQHLIFLIKSSTEQEPIQINSNSIRQNKLYETNIICMNEIPIYSKSQFQQKSTECIAHFTETLQQIAYEKNIQLCEKHYHIVQNKCVVEEPCKEFNQIIECGWQMILKSIQNLVTHCTDERQFQTQLNSLQTWINFTGTLGQAKARDQYIKYLTALCTGKGMLTNTQIQSSKMLFNIAQLGMILDVKSWHLIMKTIQSIEVQLQKSLSNSDNTDLYNQELSLLNSILEGLFSSSNTFDDQNLQNMIDALNQVTLGVMETFTTTNQQLESKQVLFGLQRIFQICKVNWYRIQKYWQFITTHFNCIVNCKQRAFRESALDIFSQLIQQGFQYFLKSDLLNKDEWQQQILDPILSMIKIPYSDVKETLLNIIFKLIQNNGHELNKLGFNQIIEILAISCDDTEPPNYVNVGFHILELLIGQFLHLLDPETTMRLLPLIQQFRIRTTEQNISFVSVGLIWQLADNLTKVCKQGTSQEELENLWTAVLMSLKDLCLDFAPDVRQSALHIIIQIILINCASFRIQFQLNLLRNLIFQVLDDIIGRVAQMQQLQVIFHIKMPKYLNEEQYPKFSKFTEQELQIQYGLQDPSALAWEETLKLMIQNLTKILKKLGQQDDQEFKINSQQLYNEAFIRLIIAYKINNLDLRWEIIKLIKDNTELIIERQLQSNVDWAKDFIILIGEFLNQKLSDNRDIKTLVNKILPDICEIYVLFFKAYYNGIGLYDDVITEILESFQQIIDNPIKIENIANIRIWMDEKQLYDYVEDLYIQINQDQDKEKIINLLLLNIKKEGSINKLQDAVIIKFSQLFLTYCQNKDQVTEFLLSAISLVSNRLDQGVVNSIKSYSKNSKPIYIEILPIILQAIEQHQIQQGIIELTKSLQSSLSWEKINNIEGLKSSIDMELSLCEWLLEQNQQEVVINYWNLLNRNLNLYQYEELIYQTRNRLMQLIISNRKSFYALTNLSKQLVQSFMRDEYMSGSLPLSRKRVQEITYLLVELQQLKEVDITPHPLLEVFECLVELITTREIDIKQPLQMLFREIAIKIKQI